jgi:hypothetical protein
LPKRGSHLHDDSIKDETSTETTTTKDDREDDCDSNGEDNDTDNKDCRDNAGKLGTEMLTLMLPG